MRLSKAEREEMINQLKVGMPVKILAEKFGVAPSSIYFQVRKQPAEIRALIESQCYQRQLNKKCLEENEPVKKVGKKKLKATEVSKMLKAGVSKREIAKALGVSAHTLYSFIEEKPKLLMITQAPPLSQSKRKNIELAEKIFDLLEEGRSKMEILAALNLPLFKFHYLLNVLPERKKAFFENYWKRVEKAVLDHRKKYHSEVAITRDSIKKFCEMKRLGYSVRHIQKTLQGEVTVNAINMIIASLGFPLFIQKRRKALDSESEKDSQ